MRARLINRIIKLMELFKYVEVSYIRILFIKNKILFLILLFRWV